MAVWHLTCMGARRAWPHGTTPAWEPGVHGHMAPRLHESLTCMATWHRTCMGVLCAWPHGTAPALPSPAALSGIAHRCGKYITFDEDLRKRRPICPPVHKSAAANVIPGGSSVTRGSQREGGCDRGRVQPSSSMYGRRPGSTAVPQVPGVSRRCLPPHRRACRLHPAAAAASRQAGCRPRTRPCNRHPCRSLCRPHRPSRSRATSCRQQPTRGRPWRPALSSTVPRARRQGRGHRRQAPWAVTRPQGACPPPAAMHRA